MTMLIPRFCILMYITGIFACCKYYKFCHFECAKIHYLYTFKCLLKALSSFKVQGKQDDTV